MDIYRSPSAADSEETPKYYSAMAFADAKPGTCGARGYAGAFGTLQRARFRDCHRLRRQPVDSDSARSRQACHRGRVLPRTVTARLTAPRVMCIGRQEDEPWAIRGIIHPAFGEPSFAEFYGSEEFLRFVHGWCHGLEPEDLVMSPMLLWCNPKKNENGPSWHRDTTWWGTGKGYFAQRPVQEGPEAYSEEVERRRWKEIQEENLKSIAERKGVSMFLALADDECHELIPGSHHRWRTPFEHDVLLPKAMKDQGVPHTPSWNGVDPLPNQVAIRLKPGEALIRNGTTIHTGHTVPDRERNTLAIGLEQMVGALHG